MLESRGVGEPAPNPATAEARVLFDELARCGVRHVVMAPGSRSTALVVAADEHPDLRLHVEVDERSAGFCALGIGRATGQPAAVVTTSGTAVANLLPAIVEADHDRIPLLALTADRPAELHGVGANQTIPQFGIFGESTRWTHDLGPPGTAAEEVTRWRWTACRAHGVAVGRPVVAPAVVGLDSWRQPGPVHLNLPFREPTVPASDDGRTRTDPFRHPLEGRPDGAPWAGPVTRPTAASAHAIEVAADALRSVAHGVVVVGGAIDGPLGPLGAVAVRLGWPVLAEPHGSGRTGGALRSPSLVVGDAAWLSEHTPELVLRVGRVTVSRPTVQLLGRTPQVVIDEHGGWVDRDDDRQMLVRGDVGPTVEALLDVLADHRPRDPDWAASWTARDDEVGAALDARLDDEGLTELRAVRDLLRVAPSGTPVVVGSSLPVRHLDTVLPPDADVRVHANRGASGIDGFVSTALGVALGAELPTLAVCGDLTLLHDGNGFLLSPDEGTTPPHLVLVVLDNDGGGIFSLLPQRTHVERFERLFGTPHGRDLGHLAALHDLVLHQPTDPEAFTAALGRALRTPGRHLVHIRTERA